MAKSEKSVCKVIECSITLHCEIPPILDYDDVAALSGGDTGVAGRECWAARFCE